MTCTYVPIPGGYAIVCTRGERKRKCVECGGAIAYLCDWKLKGKHTGRTCSRAVCTRCAKQVGREKHLCPAHARKWDAHPKNPKNAEQAGA